MFDPNKISTLSKYISDSKKILLTCHMNPDGDAIGSMIAMYSYLKSKGKEVVMMSPNYLQEFLKWMDSSDNINIYIKNYRKGGRFISESDLIIMLDFNHTSRLGEMERLTTKSKAKKVVIDHHYDPGFFSDLLISDPNRCATAELVYDIIKEMEGRPFDDPIFRESIYVGIMTDTGCLEYGTYNGHTLRIIGDLLDAGVDKEKVRLNVYNN
ncbi:MAG: DHH family phosphoesterase, partial [Bacteroidales bacterium]|nr:DHH family phosphoesterase [Bacteroidales bacterium]